MAALSRSTPSWGFLSTPSARRATHGNAELESSMDISIHALREESDPRLLLSCLRESGNFYPRSPRGERLHGYSKSESSMDISIHALREESDGRQQARGVSHERFLSTPSARRATPPTLLFRLLRSLFLSTPSARRATQQFVCGVDFLVGFLSTPSARRATERLPACKAGRIYFYPRPPRGERHKAAVVDIFQHRISIHALREESDRSRQEPMR